MTSSTPREPHSRRPRPAVVWTGVALVGILAVGSFGYVQTENSRSGGALEAAAAASEDAEGHLKSETNDLASAASRAEAPLTESENRVLDERSRLELAAAIQRSAATIAELETPAPETPAGSDGGFRWFWDDSSALQSITAQTADTDRRAASARAATAAINSAVNAVGVAVAGWEAEQTSTLLSNAEIIEVKTGLAYDGTPAGVTAVQALLDAGGHVALTYPGSTTTIITANNYTDPVALTLEPGDLVVLSGVVTGTYTVAVIAETEPWTMPATDPAAAPVPAPDAATAPKAIAMQALNWDGKLMRYLTLTPYTASAS